MGARWDLVIRAAGGLKELTTNAEEMIFFFGPIIDTYWDLNSEYMGLSRLSWEIAGPLAAVLAIASMASHLPVYTNHLRKSSAKPPAGPKQYLLSQQKTESDHNHSHKEHAHGRTALALDYVDHLFSIAGLLNVFGWALYKDSIINKKGIAIWIASSIIIGIWPAINDWRVCKYHMFHDKDCDIHEQDDADETPLKADWTTKIGVVKDVVVNTGELTLFFTSVIDYFFKLPPEIIGFSKLGLKISAPISFVFACFSAYCHLPVYRNHQGNNHHHPHPQSHYPVGWRRRTAIAFDFTTHLLSTASHIIGPALVLSSERNWSSHILPIWMGCSLVVSILPSIADINVCKTHFFNDRHQHAHDHHHQPIPSSRKELSINA